MHLRLKDLSADVASVTRRLADGELQPRTDADRKALQTLRTVAGKVERSLRQLPAILGRPR